MTLNQLLPGQQATIIHVGGSSRIRRRFAEMGILKGEVILAERVAPLGDPAEYFIKGYHLSLRHNEASQIKVAFDEGQNN